MNLAISTGEQLPRSLVAPLTLGMVLVGLPAALLIVVNA
jgi:hypothetical protein